MNKLHLGCGKHFLPGYINMEYAIDFTDKSYRVDLLGSGMHLPFKDNSLSEILSFHVLEHMPRPQENLDGKNWRKNVDDFLNECKRVLKIGGKMIVECPDVELILKEIVHNSNWGMLDHVYGLDRYPGDTHQWGYTRKSLKELFLKHGFNDIKISEGTDYHILTEPSIRIEAVKLDLKRINIEPTSACNLKCSICSRDENKRPNANMDFALYRSIMDQLFQLGLFDIEIRYFLSGEPLVAGKSLITMLKYARTLGFKNTLIHTNGTLLNKYGKGILDAGLGKISISVDGFDKSTYERVRINSDFEKTIIRINNFLLLSKGYSTKTTIQTIIDPRESISEYEEKMMSLLPGADEYYVRYPHNWNTINSITRSNNYKTKVNKCFPSENLSIYANGLVPICCADLNGDYILADANKMSIEDIWVNKLAAIRDRMIRGQSIPELCDNCERYLNISLIVDPNDTSKKYLEDAEALMQSGDYSQARNILENLIAQNSLEISAMNDLAVLEYIEGNHEQAINTLEKILVIDPKDELANENLNLIKQLENNNEN